MNVKPFQLQHYAVGQRRIHKASYYALVTHTAPIGLLTGTIFSEKFKKPILTGVQLIGILNRGQKLAYGK